MKIKLFALFLVLTLALTVALPAFAADGAATYKAKCASCHGPDGAGKIGPAVKGTSLSEADITALLTKGNDAKKAPHKKALAGLTDDDAKAVAAYIKTLK